MDGHNKAMAKRNITLWLIEKYLADLEDPERITRGVDGKGNGLYSVEAWREKIHRLLTPELQALRPDLAERAAALGIELTTIEEA